MLIIKYKDQIKKSGKINNHFGKKTSTSGEVGNSKF